jgi:dihydrosphingosine 1-phosphate phosphatase
VSNESVSIDKNKLPQWRYVLREQLLPLIRWETPYLAWFQANLRSPALDSYFAISANLGTHTFFMIMLPILFWCGYTSLGRGYVTSQGVIGLIGLRFQIILMLGTSSLGLLLLTLCRLTHILAAGVFFSGFIKDLLCLPRPLSPPLQRITMSGSAALEYGFPSSHSTNAVSVAVYALLILNFDEPDISPFSNTILQAVSYCYGCSIVVGRLYCGMHGFLDVIVGSVLGAALSIIQYWYGESLDNYVHSGPLKNLVIIILIILVLVRIHPEPADDCPCFDDSVAFAGVIIGIEYGNWHFARTDYAVSYPVPATVPFNIEAMGWLVAVTRILVGVICIFAWREVMKPSLLRGLPPIFRVVEALGLDLPRKFFKQASEYTRVPAQYKDDDHVIPSFSQIPSLIRRRRAISIGPQSEADVYETLAYRERRRRASLSTGSEKISSLSKPLAVSQDPPAVPLADDSANRLGEPLRQVKSELETYESMMGTGLVNGSKNQPELEEKEMFSRLQKPRVRYDVEVVTKLIVYSGIGWLAVEGNPILFSLVGLAA